MRIRLRASCLLAVLACLSSAGCFLSREAGGARGSNVMGTVARGRRPADARELAVRAFNGVNSERMRRGLVPLARESSLDSAAMAHARDLVGMNRLSHSSSDGRQLEHRISRLQWTWAGENLARNKGFDDPAAEAVRGWVNSPQHSRNMFRPDFNRTGVSALFDPATGFVYFVQVFIVPPA